MKKENLQEKFSNLTTYSPGKILICGGYLIINPKYRGLVICSETYFKCNGQLIENNKFKSNQSLSNNEMETKFNEKNIMTIFFLRINSINYKKSFFYKLTLNLNKNIDENNISNFFDKEESLIILKLERINIEEFPNNFNNKYKDYDHSNEYSNNTFIINTIKSSFYNYLLMLLNILNFKDFFEKMNKKTLRFNLDLDGDYRFYGYNKDLVQANIAKSIKTGLGSSSALISSLGSNIVLNLHKFFFPFEIMKNFEDLSNEIKICLLLSCYYGNNLAQNKVKKFILS